MIAVLTGDIVKSRSLSDKSQWLERLQAVWEHLQEQQPTLKWELYRGDSFQASTTQPELALHTAILLRSSLRALPEFYLQKADVRIAIGIGAAGYTTDKLSESDGEAYHFSGLTLDELNQSKQRLKLKSAWPELNEQSDATLGLLEHLMAEWTQPINETVYHHLLAPQLTQQELAAKLSLTQPTINWRINKARLDLVLKYESYFRKSVNVLLHGH